MPPVYTETIWLFSPAQLNDWLTNLYRRKKTAENYVRIYAFFLPLLYAAIVGGNTRGVEAKMEEKNQLSPSAMEHRQRAETFARWRGTPASWDSPAAF